MISCRNVERTLYNLTLVCIIIMGCCRMDSELRIAVALGWSDETVRMRLFRNRKLLWRELNKDGDMLKFFLRKLQQKRLILRLLNNSRTEGLWNV